MMYAPSASSAGNEIGPAALFLATIFSFAVGQLLIAVLFLIALIYFASTPTRAKEPDMRDISV